MNEPYRLVETKLLGEIPGVSIIAEMVGEGEFNGMIVGFKPFSFVANQFVVEWMPVAIPPSLHAFKEEIISGNGPVYKKLRKEIDRAVSFLIAACKQELDSESHHKPE